MKPLGTKYGCIAGVAVAVVIIASGCATPSGQDSSGDAVEETQVIGKEQIAGEEVAAVDAEPAPEEGHDVTEASATSDWSNLAQIPPYRIGPGDILSFRSFDDETISAPNALVRFDGYVSLPLIDDVEVSGLSREDALETVREAYADVFKNPQISLTVVEAAGKSYYVMGDVNRPAEYPYKKALNVLQAINIAGGNRDTSRATGETFTSEQGSLSLAYIIRHDAGRREVIEVDLKNLIESGPHASQVVVWPDDVIYVPVGVNLVYVTGAVARPSVFPLVEGETLLQVLTRAGWVAESVGRIKKVVIIRPISEDESEVMLVNVRKIIKTGEDIGLKPGDIIYVPRKQLVRLQEFVSQLTGSVLPLMNLYQEAYDTYYTDKRYDRLFTDTTDPTTSVLGTLQTLRDFGDVFSAFPATP